MKKFIKSKIDDIDTSINRAAQDPSPPPNLDMSVPTSSDVQPTYSLEPVDQDNTIQVEEEIVHYQSESSPNQSSISTSINCENRTPDKAEGPKVPMCRDFVRGICNRPGICKYSHIYDKTQLIGVYTFCRKYQTSICTFTKCKYVHATVFEEQHFYKTGILPPHALEHHKNVNAMLPPPPPPPLPPPPQPRQPLANTNMSMNITFRNPPPPRQNNILREDRRYNEAPRTDTLKRQWLSLNHIINSPSDRDSNEIVTKKCNNCIFMEFRLHYSKRKVEEGLLAKENLNKKICLLERKSKKLGGIISLLSQSSTNQTHNDGPVSSPNGERDETLLEQVNNIFAVRNCQSEFEEEEN